MKIQLLVALTFSFTLFGTIDQTLRNAVKRTNLYALNTYLLSNRPVITQVEKYELLKLAQEKIVKHKGLVESRFKPFFNRDTLAGVTLIAAAIGLLSFVYSDEVETQCKQTLDKAEASCLPASPLSAVTEQRVKEHLETAKTTLTDSLATIREKGFLAQMLLSGIGIYNLYKGIKNKRAWQRYHHAVAIKTAIEHYTTSEQEIKSN